MPENENQSSSQRNGVPVVFFGVVLVAVGVLILLGNFVQGLSIGKLWPLFILIPVVQFIQLLWQDIKKNAGVLVPTGILTTLTVYFLWLNYTTWDNVAFTWPVFILLPAVGLFLLFAATFRFSLLIPIFIICGVAIISWGLILQSSLFIAIFCIFAGLILFIGSFRNIGKKPKN